MPGRWSVILMVAALTAGACLYLYAAFRHAREVNTDRETVDQSAYMNYAKKMHETGYAYVGDRNRMPLYPFLLSLIYRDGLDDEAFFQRAKTFNILLSLALLAGLLALLHRYLPPLPAVVTLLVIAFSLFVHRAAYVQCELLYYCLVFAGFLLACETLRRPDPRLAVATGLVMGLAHLTKASAPPAIAAFVLAGAAAWAHRPLEPKRLVAAGLAVVSFLAVLAPYLYTSRRVFGHYFYNVNTTFYMWYDARDQIFSGTRAHGDRQGWPDLPSEQIPGPVKYLNEHTIGQILSRLERGLASIWRTARDGYGYLKYLLILATLAAAAVVWRPAVARALAREHHGLVLFVSLYLAAYLLLYAWISQVHAGLPRLILSLFLPLIFSLAVVTSSETLVPRRLSRAVSLVLLALIGRDVYLMLAGGILKVHGGS